MDEDVHIGRIDVLNSNLTICGVSVATLNGINHWHWFPGSDEAIHKIEHGLPEILTVSCAACILLLFEEKARG